MKTFWQAGRNALAHALSKIVSPAVSSASPTLRNGRQTAIVRIALATAFFLAFGLAQAQAQTGGTTSTTTLTSSPNPSQVNQTVTFTATVTGPAGSPTPTGTVTFVDDSNAADIATVQLVGGVARITRTFTETTTDVVSAQYNGDGTFATSTSNVVTQSVISGAATTTTLTASPNPAQINQQVTLTAIVAPQSGGGAPTGIVGFADISNGGPPWARPR
jgi:Bacterial Ig-like domain (group 3)